jgi:hypothetical protein
MSLLKRSAIAFFLLLVCGSLFAQGAKAGPYLGQTVPGLVPQVFAPGVISLPNRYTNDICFSRDGLECFFTVRNAAWDDYYIMTARYEKGAWTSPVRASFSNSHSMSPSLADNDKAIYFSRDQHIWLARRDGQAWGQPERLPAPVNSAQPEYSFTVSDLGNAWICSHRSDGVGQCDLWRIPIAGGKYAAAADLRGLNTMANDCIPLPGPKETYVIWSSSRPGGAGQSDIYISYADGQGGWTAPGNAGQKLNTAANENVSSLSPDGNYLFFSRETSSGSDIYWVSVKAILDDTKLKAVWK